MATRMAEHADENREKSNLVCGGLCVLSDVDDVVPTFLFQVFYGPVQ